MTSYLYTVSILALLIFCGNALLFMLLQKLGYTNVSDAATVGLIRVHAFTQIPQNARQIVAAPAFAVTASSYLVAGCICVNIANTTFHSQALTSNSSSYARSNTSIVNTSKIVLYSAENS